MTTDRPISASALCHATRHSGGGSQSGLREELARSLEEGGGAKQARSAANFTATVMGEGNTEPAIAQLMGRQHCRQDCLKFPYAEGDKDANAKFCRLCYCYVCDKPASECENWDGNAAHIGGGDESTKDTIKYRAPHNNHCNATNRGTDKELWLMLKTVAEGGWNPEGMNLGQAMSVLNKVRDDDNIICEVCGVQEDTSEVKLCSGCNLSLYCSRKCQRKEWSSHKNRCRNLSFVAALDTLHLDSKDLLDIDAGLAYAAEHMSNVRHVIISIDALHKVKGGMSRLWGEAVVTLTAEAMSLFLDSCKGNLASFWWDTCQTITASTVTKQGHLFTQLHGLEALWLDSVHFGRVDTLLTTIYQQQDTLLKLDLDWTIIGGFREPRWTRTECTAVVKAISSCKSLVNLSMCGNFLIDADIKVLVSGLSHLRLLDLRATGGDYPGSLKDKTCSIIATKLPNLRQLNLTHHSKITFSGLQVLMKRCQHLRLISSSTDLVAKEIKKLVDLAPRLLCFGIGCGRDIDLQELGKIVERIGGRCAFNNTLESCFFRPSNLSDEVQKEYFRICDLVRVKNMREGHQIIINKWEADDDKK